MTEEIKFEVGKKYILSSNPKRPATLLLIHKNYYVFELFDGLVISYHQSIVEKENIKEYREPFKNTIEGWIGYNNLETKNSCFIVSALLKKDSSDYIQDSKENILRYWSEAMHVRITLEELPEEENNVI